MDIGNFFFLLKQNYKVIKLEMQRNVDDSMYITTQSAFTSKCMVRKLDQLTLNRKMEGREKGGVGEGIFQKVISLRIPKGMAKHTVYTELASGIQMHPAHTLLPLVFFLKESYEEGEMETQIFSPAQWAETSQNFGVNLKQCLLEKGSHRCGASCWISTPPPPLSQAPSRTAEPAWLYTTHGEAE